LGELREEDLNGERLLGTVSCFYYPSARIKNFHSWHLPARGVWKRGTDLKEKNKSFDRGLRGKGKIVVFREERVLSEFWSEVKSHGGSSSRECERVMGTRRKGVRREWTVFRILTKYPAWISSRFTGGNLKNKGGGKS